MNQVAVLTMDCHYLISLLNSTDQIDWENWSEGRKIKEDLEKSADLLEPSKKPDAPPSGQRMNRKVRPIRRQMPFQGLLDDPFFTSFFGDF